MNGERCRVKLLSLPVSGNAKVVVAGRLMVVVSGASDAYDLAEKGGEPRDALLSFINDSVMGSVFSKLKTPEVVKLDWTPTFTPISISESCRKNRRGHQV